MTVPSAAALLDALPDAHLIVELDGRVIDGNAGAARLLARERPSLRGLALPAILSGDEAALRRYLAACAGASGPLPGAVTLGSGAAARRLRCDGMRVAADAPGGHPLVLLRLRPAEAAVTRFVLLNEQISALTREIQERRRVEAERLELLREAREAQRSLSQQRDETVAARDALLEQTLQLERARSQLERLHALTSALSSAATPDAVARAVLDHCMDALEAVGVSVGLLDEARGVLRMVQYAGYPDEGMRNWQEIPMDANLPLPEATRTGVPIFLESQSEWKARYGDEALVRLIVDSRAWAALPLWTSGRPLGVIGLSFARPGPFSPDARMFMLAAAEQSAQALVRARLYAEAAEARDEAQRANRAKTEFLATMSHELRTPLNAIAGYVELLDMELRGPITDAQRADLTRIRRSQQHLLSLVNDVLSFARMETGHVEYHVTEFDIGEPLREVESLIAPQLAGRSLAYACHVPADLRVRADRDKLQQVVLNLLSNALKFTDPGGRVSLAAQANGATVQVRVHDTGRGIPGDKLEAIFEPFVQIERGLTRTREGAGLGLSISRQFARAMGGDLTVESTLGAGATFTLLIPAATAGPDEPGATAPSRARSAAG